MIRHHSIFTVVGIGLGMGLMGMEPQSSNSLPSMLARPPYNCLTREVWSPAKQAWCDRFGPHSGQDDWPELTRPGNLDNQEGRDRYTPIALDTLSNDTPLIGTDPKSMALSVVDLPAAEGNSQKRTSVSIKKGQSAVVMLSQVGLGDDSVQGIRYRLEFEPNGTVDDEEQWQLVWVGRQQLCWPGRGPEEWTNEPCV